MRPVVVGMILVLSSCAPDKPDEQGKQVAASGAAGAAEAVADGPVFDGVGELTMPDEVQGELRGARVADPKEWQASFYTQSDGGSCTASIVGDQVLLTAAHCVANGATVTLRRAGVLYRAPCEHAPEYAAGGADARTADYALCAIDKSVPGVPAERVNTDPNAVKLGKDVLLTGFGCTTNQGTLGNDGIYRIGGAKVDSLPSGTNNDITTKGGAGLCFGDSGGPAFTVPGPGRVQISVNSRVENLDPNGTNLGAKSFLSSLTTPVAVRFLKDWSQRNKRKICGLDQQAATCRP